MRNPKSRSRTLALVLTATLAVAWPAALAGQTLLTEGYDPMRQITAQIVKANLLVVLDTSGSMAGDRWGNGIGASGPGTEEVSVQDQSATGRLVWTETEAPSMTSSASGTVAFNQNRVSNNTSLNRTFAGVAGVVRPGIYTYGYTGSPFTYTDSGTLVYPTQLPVLDASYRLVYKCRPTGTWRAVGQVPWDSTKSFYENDAWDFNSCTGPFTRVLRFDLPSRMSNVKNALGDSVYLAETYTPPAPTNPAKLQTRWMNDASWAEPWKSAVIDGRTTPVGPWLSAYTEGSATWVNNPHWYSFRIADMGYDLKNNGFVYNPTGNNPANPATIGHYYDAGRPFNAYYYASDTGRPVLDDTDGNPVKAPATLVVSDAARTVELGATVWAIGQPRPGFGTSRISAPRNIVGINAQRINFGLQTYAGTAAPFPFAVPVDTFDGTNVTRMLSYLAPLRTPASASNLSFTAPQRLVPVDTTKTETVTPLGASGYTPTRWALEQAANAIKATFYGVPSAQIGTLTTSGIPTGGWSLPADPKRACNRPYGVVLVTDGLSNYGNPSNRNWISPCGTGPAACDVGSSGYDCPNNWTAFAAQISSDIYTTALDPGAGFPRINPRTWAIGVSPAVGPCELSFISYMGRTDAASPSGDAGYSGYDVTKNPNLPNPASPVAANPIDASAGTYDGPTGQYRFSKDTTKVFNPTAVGHGHNAFFATDAQAIRDAFVAIVNATATGDYATNAPVSGMSAAKANMVYLPSTDFPTWRGHIYAYDTSKYDSDTRTYIKNPLYPDYPHWLVWDAGLELNATPSSARKIFTWNPSSGNALVEVTAANLVTLQGLAGTAAFTAAVVDFIRGNNGSGTARSWRLGPMVNSAPALVGPPGSWLQGTVVDHKAFQSANASRDPLLWVGSNDGMMHAFRIEDGKEQIALLAPDLLAAQVTLYQNSLKPRSTPTGQPADIFDHVYGVASSFRFGDVYGSAGYKTVGIVSFGPGGDDVAAIDVSTVPKPDASPYPASPVSVLWTKKPGTMTNQGELPDLQETWSIPAMGPVSLSKWRLVAGSGFRAGNTRATQLSGTGFLAPKAYVLDPSDGDLLRTITLTSKNSPAPFVGNQAFADAVLFDPKAKSYQDDNIGKMGLQADLNGRIWFTYDSNPGSLSFDATTIGIDVSTDQSQPLYFNPAASGYGATTAGCVAYAFGSGALYERSGTVTGSAVGTSPSFIPRLYVATSTKASMTAQVPATNIVTKAIQGAWTYTFKDANGQMQTQILTLGRRTQLTAPPFMLVPKSGTGTSTAIFLLYDPDNGCNGFSYVAVIEFAGSSTCQPTNVTYSAFPAGIGAASGFTIAGDKVLVSKSGIGQGQKASLFDVPDVSASFGGTITPKIKWWKELK